MAQGKTARRRARGKLKIKRLKVAEVVSDICKKVACGCVKCTGSKKWPRHYVGSDDVMRPGQWVSYECYVMPLDDTDGDLDDLAMSSPRDRCPEQDAIDAGLLVVTPRRLKVRAAYTVRYSGVCETCEGVKPSRRRYCLGCEVKMRRELAAAGWDREQVDAWCAGADWPAEGR